jgi:hypothetical protein
MGNRAVITINTHKSAPCIYLHWNGDRASVEGFLAAAKQLGLSPNTLGDKGFFDAFAELLAAKFFKVEVGLTIDRQTYGKSDTDNRDNGVYIINPELEIIGREFHSGEEEVNAEKTAEITSTIVGDTTGSKAA